MLDAIILIGCFFIAFLLSTVLIRLGIPILRKPTDDGDNMLPESSSKRPFDLRSVGFWIGFFETIMVFALVYQTEYGALAIIVGAKEFVRKEKIQKDAAYYLLGTLINVSVAILFALLAKNIISKI